MLGLMACGRAGESVRDHEVKTAVWRYNQQLPQAYRRGSAALLEAAATIDEARRVEDVIGFLGQGRMVMDARQEQLEAEPPRFTGEDRAELVTTEVWWYRHHRPDTGEVVQAPRRVQYRNRYKLLRIEGRWLVDRLEELGFEDLPLERPSRGGGAAAR